jgi:CRP-like cAMP-binding protein
MHDLRASYAVLRKSHLLQGLSDRALEAVGELTEQVGFNRGDVIVSEGDIADAFYLITEGTAVVEQQGSRLRDLGDGDFFGEISLIDGQPRTATITATSPVVALRVNREHFHDLMEKHPSIRLELLMALTERLRKVAPNATD